MNKTVLEINSVNHGSTGNIMNNIADYVSSKDYTAYTCCANSRSNRSIVRKNQIFIGSRADRLFHIIASYLTGKHGFYSYFSTKSFLKKISRISPDIIHMHNFHGDYINLSMFFEYVKENKIPVVWTLHDCWAFTGHCPYYSILQCEKWITGCKHCNNYKEYPKSRFDDSEFMWNYKKNLFLGVDKLVIVTPSIWLSEQVKRSFLGNYPVRIIHNGINLNIFSPKSSEFRKKYGISEKQHMVLGVSFSWGYRKGLDVFNKLAELLDDTFVIVLVGVNEVISKQLSKRIISIEKTNNQEQLAQIYSAADVFVNPTREETLGLVNIEANACGTPVITFDTDGSPECISSKSGFIVEKDNINDLKNRIEELCISKTISSQDCVNNAARFGMEDKDEEYYKLYETLIR